MSYTDCSLDRIKDVTPTDEGVREYVNSRLEEKGISKIEILLDEEDDCKLLRTILFVLEGLVPEPENFILNPPTYQELRDILGPQFPDSSAHQGHRVISLAAKSYNNI